MSLFGKFLKREDSGDGGTVSIEEEQGIVYSPVNGKVITLESVDDGMFSEKILGDGMAVVPSDGNFIAPVSGTVESAFPTGHAYGIKTDSGLEVLIHIGLDTVNLNGKGFRPQVRQGEKVKAGDKLAEVDLEVIRKAGYPTETMIIVTSGNQVTGIAAPSAEIKAGEKLFETKAWEGNHGVAVVTSWFLFASSSSIVVPVLPSDWRYL